MANNIKSLLAKKGWTGEEVGKALIASLLHDIKNQGKEYEPLFTQADFDKMENSLSTDRDYLAYGVYRDIYSSLVDTFNRGQGLYQQFYNGYYRYLMELNGAMQADHALADSENFPLIMTQAQYERLTAKTLEYKKTFGESFYSLLFNLLEDYLEALEAGNTDAIPASILQAIETTKKEPAKDQPILRSYNELYGDGYYQLPDGRRSDKLSKEEWENALKEKFLETHKLTVNGVEADAEQTARHFNGNRLLRGYELFFNGADAIRAEYKKLTGKELPEGSEQSILAELEEIISGIGGSSQKDALKTALGELYGVTSVEAEWHYYTELPEGLTQFDLLDLIVDVSRYGETDEKAHLRDFKKYFPALYEALEAYIKEAVPEAKSLKPAQRYKQFVGWGTLAERNIGNYETLLTVSDTDIIQYLQRNGLSFADNRRAVLKGIAVIKNPHSFQVDAEGNYKEEHSPLLWLDDLDSIAKNTEKCIEIESFRNDLFIPALRYIYCYNSFLELLADCYDIDGIEVAKLETAYFESQLTALNNLIYSLYFTIYGDAEEKARKRKLIKDIFQPVDAEELKPTEEAKQNMKLKLAKLGISTTARKELKSFEAFIAELGLGEGAC